MSNLEESILFDRALRSRGTDSLFFSNKKNEKTASLPLIFSDIYFFHILISFLDRLRQI